MSPTVVALFSALLLMSRNVRGWYIAFPNNSAPFANDLRDSSPEWTPPLIFPGTKWCGSGNVAQSPDDLGTFAMTDACCREHDNCDDVIESMQTTHGLTNNAFYTRLHCSCDERFYDCLHSSEELVSAKVGFLYFSVLNTKCFREDYPIVGCKRHSLIPRRCLEYELDESQPKMYQWFDVPVYFQNGQRVTEVGRHIRSLGSAADDDDAAPFANSWKSISTNGGNNMRLEAA
ncbi:phospholipase A2-like [Odontomachus brunneus]|uniref:phospholipase A2-like n=1 Tax=Odontomachus brunneus TaxID=486640 RepID=UPI0013F1FC53|nr:phospholipase A2-like [Odontomachus brunneus]